MAARRGGGSWASHPGAKQPQAILFLEAFGQLTRHAETLSRDLGEGAMWSAFLARAEMMGWSMMFGRSSSPPQRAGLQEHRVLWRVHEAELNTSAGSSRIGWAQVGLEVGISPVTALPALIQCLDDAFRRFGMIELSGLQVTVSHLQSSNGSYLSNLVSWLGWFSASAGAGAEALVAMDDGLFRERSNSELIESLHRMGNGSFNFGPMVTVHREHAIDVAVEAPLDVALSPADRGVSVRLPEWSATSAAWVLAFVIETALVGRPGTRDLVVRLTRIR